MLNESFSSNQSSKFNSSLLVANETIEINENLANSNASSIFFKKLTDVDSQNLFNNTTLNITYSVDETFDE
jgi:hypothetical protein